MTTKVHKGEETQKSIVVGIEVAIVEWFVLGIPQSIDKLLLLIVITENRRCSNGTYKSDAMTKFAETACLQYLVALR